MPSLFPSKKTTSAAPDAGEELFDEHFTKRLEVLAVVARRIHTGRTRAEPGTIASQTRSSMRAVSASSTCRPTMGR